MTARNEILKRIRIALTDRPQPPPMVRDYRVAGTEVADLDQFVDRLVDYRATVHRCGLDSVAPAVAEILTGRGLARLVVPDGFPDSWVPAVDVIHEPVTTSQLDVVGAIITSCAAAIAETGTIILDAGEGQGARALSLVPDYHLVVVLAAQVHASVADAVAAVPPTRPLTWISGPSATSDIELRRVEGVHGPRVFDVLLVE